MNTGPATRTDLVVTAFAVLVVALIALTNSAGPETNAAPKTTGPVQGIATLLSDPEPSAYATRVIIEIGGDRLQLDASSGAAPALLRRLSGERVFVAGDVGELPDRLGWLRRRGVVGVMSTTSLTWWTSGSPAAGWANALRRTLEAGAVSLHADQRSLFAGFVLGDDRFQSELVTDDFRAAGLGHLLAVSGSNVAFLLAMLAPLVARLDLAFRVPCILGALAFFALLTRAEPSVLRATVMAGTAAVLAALGRPSNGRRLLAVAAAGLVVVSPGLMHSLGFQLSVLASGGIVWMSPSIAAALPGPTLLANAIAVTVAAQLWVSPLLVATFGGVPVAALPANIVAGPVAGPISAWGLTGGWVAGIVGGRVAAILHLPTRAMLAWVQFVARLGARAPLGELTAGPLVLVVLALLILRFAGRRRLGIGLLVMGLALPAVLPVPDRSGAELAPGVGVWRAGDAVVVVLTDEARPTVALEVLRRDRVAAIHALIVTTNNRPSLATARALVERYNPELQWSLQPASWGTLPAPGTSVRIGGLQLEVNGGPLGLGMTVTHDAGARTSWAEP